MQLYLIKIDLKYYVLNYGCLTTISFYLFKLSNRLGNNVLDQLMLSNCVIIHSSLQFNFRKTFLDLHKCFNIRQYHVYPPFGFITQAFIPLGAFLLLVGIFSSAKVISRDSAVRKEFYKSASSQLSLLKTIGISQMEKELEKDVKAVEKKVSVSEPTGDIPQLEEQEAKEILHDVLNELYYSKGKK